MRMIQVRLQRQVTSVLPKAPVRRIIRSLLRTVANTATFISKDATAALHESVDAYMHDVFTEANRAATFARRGTVSIPEIEMAVRYVPGVDVVDLATATQASPRRGAEAHAHRHAAADLAQARSELAEHAKVNAAAAAAAAVDQIAEVDEEEEGEWEEVDAVRA
jgi:histone H3/H4